MALKPYLREVRESKAALIPLLLIIPAALITGLVSAAGSNQLTALWLAAAGGIALLALSTDMLIRAVVVLALLVVGQAMYFLGLNQAVWFPFGLGLLLYLRVPMAYASGPYAKLRQSPPLTFWVLAFIAIVILSMLANMTDLLQAFRAAKSYTFLWSIFFVIAYCGVKQHTLDQIWKFCIWMVFLQIPLVLYQYLVVAPKRGNLGGRFGVSWDAIVGGFGGDPMGGGASGTMAWFLVFMSVLCFALYRRQQIGTWLLFSVLLASGVCVGLAEVKVVVVLLPLGMGALLIPYFRKHPFMVLLGLLTSAIVALGVLMLYGYLRSKTGTVNYDILEVLNDSFWYSLDPTYINYVTGEMGRVASLVHWWQENGFGDPLHTLIGHGPGSSSISGVFGAGEMARRYPFEINRSTLSIFLWDIGLTGVLCYILLITKGMQLAFVASKRVDITQFQAAALEAIFGGLFMVLVMLPYGKDVSEVPALGVILMLFLGYTSLIASALPKK